MSCGVASPCSDADLSNQEKTKKEKQVCKQCNVEIPPGSESLQKHEAGKRHERMRAQCDAVEALAKRSVFIKIAPARAQSPADMETDAEHVSSVAPAKVDPKLRLQKEEIERVMARFGQIERVLCRAESGHYAIVEYGRDEEAKAALASKSVLMACSSVTADGTMGPIQMATVLVTERRVNFSAAAPTEKQRINVDEVIDAVSRLIIDPSDDAYTVAIDEVIRYIVLSEEQLRQRDSLAARLEEQLKKFFVAPSVRIFGSSITSIGTVDSDIDMCLMLSSAPIDNGGSKRMQFLHEQKQRDKYTLLTGDAAQIKKKKVQASEVKRLSGPDRVRFVSKMLNEVRKECGWMGVQRPVVDCRLPIVRFLLDREILVDLSVDNAIGVAKSAYIRDLIKADASGRLRRMLIGLRFWALSNGLFDAQEKEHKGHFNAYMLNLLAIAFLQSNGALPPFQHTDTPEYAAPGGKWRIDFVVPPYTLEAVTIQAFMKSFFVHMTSGVSLRESVIVGRTGEQLSLSEFVTRFPEIIDRGEGAGSAADTTHAAQAPATFEFSLMNVQDPIEQSHNVTATLNEKYVRRMRHMMMRSLHAMKGEKDSFVSILSIEKRLARENAHTPTSGDVSMEENGHSYPPATTSSMLRPLTAMVEPVKADATVAVCYPREMPATMAAMMRASAFVFETVLLAEEVEDPTTSSSSSAVNGGQTAAKRRRALSDEAREKAEESRRGGGMMEGREQGEGTILVSASIPPEQPGLYNWGIYALPARSWIGRRNVKRKLMKEHAGKEEIEIESLVSHELLAAAPAPTVPLSPILIVRVEFGFHSDAMMMRFHRLEGAPLDLVNMSHFLEGNGLLPKYAHSLLPLLMENGGAASSSSTASAETGKRGEEEEENKRPMSGGKRKHEEEPMEM